MAPALAAEQADGLLSVYHASLHKYKYRCRYTNTNTDADTQIQIQMLIHKYKYNRQAFYTQSIMLLSISLLSSLFPGLVLLLFFTFLK